MYQRYKGPPDRWYSVSTVAAILDNCFTELVFCGLHVFHLAASFSKTINTLEGNGNSLEGRRLACF